MIFLKLFLICTSKDLNLAEKWTNLAKNLFKNFNSAEFIKVVFSKSGSGLVALDVVMVPSLSAWLSGQQ